MKSGNHRIQTIVVILILAVAVVVVSLLGDVFQYSIFQKKGEGTEEPQVDLELSYAYQNPQWNSAVQTIIADFEQDHPEILIHDHVTYEDKVYENELTKKVARDDLGDIIQLKSPMRYAESGLLTEISSDVSDQLKGNYEYDGKVYGAAAIETTWGVLYNKDLFEELGLEKPETYAEFQDICQKLKNSDITPIGVGGADLWHMEYWVNHFFRADVISSNEDWLTDCEAGNVSWTDAEPQQMLADLNLLFERGYVNSDWYSTKDTELIYSLANQDVAMIYTGPWTAVSVMQENPDLNLGWFYVPDNDGTVVAADNLDTYWSVTASCGEDPEKYEAAMTFLSYFYSADEYTALCQTTFAFPATNDNVEYQIDDVRKDVHDSFLAADVKCSIYIGNDDTPENFEAGMLEIVREVLNEELSEEEGLAQIQQLWDQAKGEEQQ